jgi:hypothetical protein
VAEADGRNGIAAAADAAGFQEVWNLAGYFVGGSRGSQETGNCVKYHNSSLSERRHST